MKTVSGASEGFFDRGLTGESADRVVDQVVVEQGTVPNDDVYADLKDGSVNRGEIDIDAFVRVTPQRLLTDLKGRYQLFRIGDAVASRNIHAAIYDARRLALPI